MTDRMKILVIGAGAMGSTYGGLLALQGHHIQMVDTRQEVVDAISKHGLKLEGVCGTHQIAIPVSRTTPKGFDADCAMIWTDTNNTRHAADEAALALSKDGYAVTFQNGIGNIETLCEVLGQARVVAGSSMCSAASSGPGQAILTHRGKTSLGEIDGTLSDRAARLAEALRGASFDVDVRNDILSLVWTKFALNCSINAITAVTGLRMGELARLPATDLFQDRVMDEILADPDLRATVKKHTVSKYSRPSMLQAIDAGKRTEIDALNGQIVERGRALGIPTPYNESLVMLLKGVELKATIARGRTEEDYQRLEAEAASELLNKSANAKSS
jgi:2-dehydropantoate 2-reductase